MNPTIRNILAVIVGWIGGSLVNMGLVQLGHKLYPIEGVDLNDLKAVAEIMPTLDFKYFIFPFLAHALGTLIGATIAGLIAASYKMKMALIVGILFLIGGIVVHYMLTGPNWFTVVDTLFAYIPMALIGGAFAVKRAIAN